MRAPRPSEELTVLTVVQRASAGAPFRSRLRATLEEGPEAVDRLIRSYDDAAADHHLAVAGLAADIGRRLGLAPDTVRGIELASSIHDIGEIGTCDADGTGGPGTPAHRLSIHPGAGAAIVDGVRFPWPVAVMILQHHERLDGSGYPDGAGGPSILVSSRVIAVADAVVTRSDQVPTLAVALELLIAGRGIRYDAEAVDACLTLVPNPSPGIGLVVTRTP